MIVWKDTTEHPVEIRMSLMDQENPDIFAPVFSMAASPPDVIIRGIVAYHLEVKGCEQCTLLACWVIKKCVESGCNAIETNIVEMFIW